MAIEKLNKTYVNNQTKLNAEDFQENVDKIDELVDNVNSVETTAIVRSTLTPEITMKSGYSYDSDRRYFVARNNTFDLDVMIYSNTDLPTTLTTVATISADHAPLRDVFFTIFSDNGVGAGFAAAICRITTSGNIDVAALQSGIKRINVKNTWIR